MALSPPYTSFLKPDVDFAIVSASMPRVDSRVQEFLRHEIPRVVSDYLVEYVCKPGYPLSDMCYITPALGQRNPFRICWSRSEEISADEPVPFEDSTDDISCSICGSQYREEVMLMCGDEAGAIGCGIDTHARLLQPAP